MVAPVSEAVLVRLQQAFARAHPDDEPIQTVRRARNLVESLRTVGLDVVFLTWIDEPATAQAQPGTSWDPFIEGMRAVYYQNKDRQPWRPEGF